MSITLAIYIYIYICLLTAEIEGLNIVHDWI